MSRLSFQRQKKPVGYGLQTSGYGKAFSELFLKPEAWSLKPSASPFSSSCQVRGSEPKLSCELDDEGAVLEEQRSALGSIPNVVVHDKELAPRLILPSEAEVRVEGIGDSVVLHQAADE